MGRRQRFVGRNEACEESHWWGGPALLCRTELVWASSVALSAAPQQSMDTQCKVALYLAQGSPVQASLVQPR